ncbi:hypothetical protein TWF569_011001 [Orbilia oligospora]|uniref:Aminotransferase class I/classII large domain-containing protein n=1 Tax=Orbilia oligospora TaxID=2813651 RepID=A0A7C8NEW9_ORBOL|nr:hypothetical protein TWF103_004283 [Orbilia oligospora]KAF3080287.1 hypothetical protein TWF706_002793 [Orbilia oligospora]KAF3102010.1 hypothetical protein TWF102_004738 [Orbilia oligospora]KAF3125836.1 hypothetical protein TWF703_010656 [Orbilia oligospora]KAF3132131.1 hypothetical protein TWF569_011001 [Orbilia oligospora]
MQLLPEDDKMGSTMQESLSKRALESADAFGAMAGLMKVFQNMYNKEKNPNGIISLGVAENSLMHKELVDYYADKIKVTSYDLTYGAGPGGSPILREALASLYNRKFSPTFEVKPEHVYTAIGVSGVLDLLFHTIADEGDAILIGRPIYTGFAHDLYGRSKLKLVPVSLKDVDPMGPEAIKYYEKELQVQRNNGVKVRGIILCNPHNPLGKCYTPEVIKEYAKFCNSHQIHFISDEIYALSIYSTPSNTSATPFTSAFAVPGLREVISPHLIHVVYGMSKDFCANGLRMGCLISPWNDQIFLAAVVAVGLFQWPSSLPDIAWRTILNDHEFLDQFVIENQKKLGEHYQILVNWFEKHNIPYVAGSNAGFFVWTDLRRYLAKIKLPKGDDGKIPGGKTNIPGQPEGAQKRDKILWDKMIDGGVYVGSAEMFFGEEHGWYRFSFSTPREELELGLSRMEKVLKKVDEEAALEGLEGLNVN